MANELTQNKTSACSCVDKTSTLEYEKLSTRIPSREVKMQLQNALVPPEFTQAMREGISAPPLSTMPSMKSIDTEVDYPREISLPEPAVFPVSVGPHVTSENANRPLVLTEAMVNFAGIDHTTSGLRKFEGSPLSALVTNTYFLEPCYYSPIYYCPIPYMAECDIVCKTDCRRYLFHYSDEIAEITIARYQAKKRGEAFSLSEAQGKVITDFTDMIAKAIDKKKDPPCGEGVSTQLTGKAIADKLAKIVKGNIANSIWLGETTASLGFSVKKSKVSEGEPCKFDFDICTLMVEITPNDAAAKILKGIDEFQKIDAKIIQEGVFGHEAGHAALNILAAWVMCERIKKSGKIPEANIGSTLENIVTEVIKLMREFHKKKDSPEKLSKNENDLKEQANNSKKESKDFVNQALNKKWIEKKAADNMKKQLEDFSTWLKDKKNCKEINLRKN